MAANTDIIAPNWVNDTAVAAWGYCPNFDTAAMTQWDPNQKMLYDGWLRYISSNSIFNVAVVSTYTPPGGAGVNCVGCLGPDGSIVYAPQSGTAVYKMLPSGQTQSFSGINSGYMGAVLAPNGDVHFLPASATTGQKISPSNVVSTYSLPSTFASFGYIGGALLPNGEIHFIPCFANAGTKIAANGTAYTYTLPATVGDAYEGGCLNMNGELVCMKFSATDTLFIRANGYPVTVTGPTGSFNGAAMNPDGIIYSATETGTTGLKMYANNTLTTYSIPGSGTFYGAVCDGNGDIHLVPFTGAYAVKIDRIGIVSTYPTPTTASNMFGGIQDLNGDLHFINFGASFNMKVSIGKARLPGFGMSHNILGQGF